jgi:hypothetical protein
MTFRSCSSPAPTRVKPQPAPAILSEESVYTTLSITHHTRKRPTTGPRSTHGPQPRRGDLPLPDAASPTPARPPPTRPHPGAAAFSTPAWGPSPPRQTAVHKSISLFDYIIDTVWIINLGRCMEFISPISLFDYIP